MCDRLICIINEICFDGGCKMVLRGRLYQSSSAYVDLKSSDVVDVFISTDNVRFYVNVSILGEWYELENVFYSESSADDFIASF